MFLELNQNTKITTVNMRSERHGDETKMAADIFCETRCANDILDRFEPGLRSALYKQGEPDLLDEEVDLGVLTALRFPHLKNALKTDHKLTGYDVTIPYGIGGDSDVVLEDVTLDKFSMEPQEGGTVLLRFRLITHPQMAEVGKLCSLIQNEITIEVTPPPAASVQELFGDDADAELEEEAA